MVTQEIVNRILRTYEEAWVKQDPDKILSIFKKDGVYHERVLLEPFVGHKEIKKYWIDKVVNEQSDINFKLLNTFIDGDTLIAEWDATFYSNKEKATIHIKEVAIIVIEGEKIASLREYWQSERI